MDQMEAFLPNISHLTHLTLQAKSSIDLVDGYRWKMLTSRFVTFNFNFSVALHRDDQILDSFRTSFWLEEKHWYVAYNEKHLFSVPHFAPVDVIGDDGELFFSTTAPDNAIIYDRIKKYTSKSYVSPYVKCYHHTETLEFDLGVHEWTRCLCGSFDLSKIQHLSLKSPIGEIPFKCCLRAMPRLHTLSIDCYLAPDFIEKIRNNRFENIRTLEIHSYILVTDISYIIEEFFRCFPRVERLYMSYLPSRKDMTRMIDQFKYLSNASFIIESPFNQDERNWFSKPELTIREVRRLTNDNFTCRYNRFSSDTSWYQVSVWIGEQVSPFMYYCHLPTALI
jgi:hypothetical protein